METNDNGVNIQRESIDTQSKSDNQNDTPELHMCKRCPFTSSATDSFIIIIYASGLLNYGCCFGVLLGDGKILVTPGRVFMA